MEKKRFLPLTLWAISTIDVVFIVSVYAVTAQWRPFCVLRFCIRHCWANLRERVAGEQPGSNVCRYIPNRGIAFLVIAISICALLSLLSHFRLSFISFPLSFSSLALIHVLRHTHTESATFSLYIVSPSSICLSPWLTLIWCLNMWVFNTFFSCLWETNGEERVYPDYCIRRYLLGKVRHKHVQMHNHVQMRTDPKH